MDTAVGTAAPEEKQHNAQLDALSWVQAELRRSLETAHKALRRYLKEAAAIGRDDLDAVDPAVLRTARTQLHQGAGALEMVGQSALATVLRGAEGLVQRFINRPALVTPAAVQAVERVSFALLDYLDRTLAGKTVSPLMIFPQYQAALQLSAADRVHPADLWPRPWQWLSLPVDNTATPRQADDSLRGEMETLVLALMRDPQPSSFARLSELCADLAAGYRHLADRSQGAVEGLAHLVTLWQLAAACFEAFAAGLLDSDVHSKRLASRLLAQLRQAARSGGDAVQRLAQDLLFFCAHAQGRPHAAVAAAPPAPRLAAVREAWQLQAWPTADYGVSRLGLFDPAQVALAKRRVGSAKDSWSAVAGGEQHRVAGLLEPFALVGESLQKLFPTGDKLAQALSMAAAHTVASDASPSPALAMEVATALLYLEAALDDGELDQPELAARVQHLAGRVNSVRSGAEPKPLDIWMEDLYRRVSDRQTMGSVVQELRASLSEIEKQIDQYFRNPAERAVLIPVPAQLSSMRGVLSVLGLHHASQAALHMRDDVDALAQTVVDPQQAIQTGTFNRLADNLGALSFLIDMLSVQPQMAKSLFRFDASTGSLSAVMGQTERVSALVDIDTPAPVAAPAAPATAAPAVPSAATSARPVAPASPSAFIPEAAVTVPAVMAPALTAPDTFPRLHEPVVLRRAEPSAEAPLGERLQTLADDAQRASVSDHEVVRSLDQLAELALQDAQRELSAMLMQAQVRLREAIDPATSRALRDELARAITLRLQAKVQSQPAQPLTPPAPALAVAVAEAPGAPQAAGVAALEFAFPLLSPFPPLPSLAATGSAAAPAATGLEDDAEMREVFIDEAREVIAGARAALHRLAQAADNKGDMTEVRRAFHTLKGSSRMVGLRDFGDAAWACEQLYNARLAQMTSLEPAMREFSHDALNYLGQWVEAIAADQRLGHHSAAVTEAADALRLSGELRPIVHPAASAAPPAKLRSDPLPESLPEPLLEPTPAPPLVALNNSQAVDSELQRWVPSLPNAADLDLTLPLPATAADPVLLTSAPDSLAESLPELVAEPEPPPAIDTSAALGAVQTPVPSGSDLDLDIELELQRQDVGSFAATVVLSDPLPQNLSGPALEGPDLPAPDLPLELPLNLQAEALPEVEPKVNAAEVNTEPLPQSAEPDTPPPIDAPEVLERELAELDEFFGFSPDPQARFGRPTEPGELPASEATSLIDLLAKADPKTLPVVQPVEPEVGWNRVSGHFAPLDLELDPTSAEAAAAQPEPAPVFEDEPFKVVGPLRISIPLFNIFLNEADELSRRLVTELAEWALEWHTQPVPESCAALAHGLAGSSGTVGGADLCALARALEHALIRSAETGLGRGRAGEAELFSDAAEEIRRLLHQFAAGFLREVAPGMMDRLAAHERWPAPALEVEDGAGPDLAEVEAQLVSVLPAAPQTSERHQPPMPLEPLLPPLPPLDPQHSFAAIPPPAPTPALRLVSTGARADAFDDDRDIDAQDQVDAELFPIFDEEAEELLPQLRQRLRDWMHHPADSSQPAACMRTLHTFKGGARLAGAMRLGEMAHRLETAIEHLAARQQLQAADVEPLLVRADAMATTLESLRRPANLAPLTVVASSPVMPPLAPGAEGAVAGVVDAAVETDAAALAPAVAALTPMPSDALDDDPVLAALAATSASGIKAGLSSTEPVSAAEAAIDWSRFTLSAQRGAALLPRPAAAAPVRVRAALLDRLVNHAGEVSITRARIDADVRTLQGSLSDLTESLERMRRQLRDIEVQAETQISSRLEAAKAASQIFDPLEMDRFTRFQELTRFMAESVNDVATLQRGLQRTLQSAEDELAAQARLTRELQDDLLRTRMVEFESAADRLYRTVRQAAKDSGKSVKLEIVGGAIEVDRGVLERMIGSFEHLLRNCVAHGVEHAEQRQQHGKPADGHISIHVAQAGNEVVVEIADDGAGLDLARIRERAIARGLLDADVQASEDELVRLIFQSGFSTAEQVTELSGRGVGLDVVRAEVVAMGGSIETLNRPGQGTTMRLRLPLTTAVTQVVMLRCGAERVAVPTTLVELVRRVPTAEVLQAYESGELASAPSSVDTTASTAVVGAPALATMPMPFFWLSALLHPGRQGLSPGRSQTVVVLRSAQQRVAVHVDEVLGNQEVVVKNVGPQLAHVPGLAGVTLLPSGAVALIYNPVALANVYGAEVRRQTQHTAVATAADAENDSSSNAAINLAQASAQDLAPGAGHGAYSVSDNAAQRTPLVMVVDDSLTVRRVTQRLLMREGYRVVTAKDGLDALERLAMERPAVLLSDIEMPRMDGFDLLRNVRADAALVGLPVAMITSRIAQKHRDHALALGADHYLGKPYAEDELLAWVAQAVSARHQHRVSPVV